MFETSLIEAMQGRLGLAFGNGFGATGSCRHRSASFLTSVLLFGAAVGMVSIPLHAQDADPSHLFGASADVETVSKYIWRGQRLTNDWSLQPAGTLTVGPFSVNIWGTLDLTAVNEGDSLLLPQNPLASSGASGLRGKFSEVDYTFSFSHSVSDAMSIETGSIVYTFPERSASLPTSVEIYGGVTFESLPLSPSATLYVDVDETRKAGSTGLYFQIAGEHSIPFRNRVFTGLDVSSWLSFANRGFGSYYYGHGGESGAHDFNLTISAPIQLGEHWSAGAFVAYSALLGGFRDQQFQDPRGVYRGTAGSPATFADTVWGGFTLSLAF